MIKLMFCLFLVLFSAFSVSLVFCSGEFDTDSVVSSVIDGDTFVTTSEGIIRLADVDAPETYEIRYQASKDYLFSLIYGKTVYLDIDDIYRTGGFGRLICVVYVSYNSTHYLNVNQALLAGNYAEMVNYDNEFSPYSWELYVNKNDIPEFPTWIILTLFVSVTLTVLILRKRLTKSGTVS